MTLYPSRPGVEPGDDAAYRLLLVALEICSSKADPADEDHHPIILCSWPVEKLSRDGNAGAGYKELELAVYLEVLGEAGSVSDSGTASDQQWDYLEVWRVDMLGDGSVVCQR